MCELSKRAVPLQLRHTLHCVQRAKSPHPGKVSDDKDPLHAATVRVQNRG